MLCSEVEFLINFLDCCLFGGSGPVTGAEKATISRGYDANTSQR